MTLKIFIYTHNSTLPIDQLQRMLPANVDLSYGEEFPTQADFEVLVHGFPSREQIEASPNLRVVVAPFAGAPKETIDLLREYPHIALHSVHFNVAATAELAVGLMLAAAKRILPLDRELRDNDWRSRYGKTPVIILQDRTVTILGYGRIGQHIGATCQALGMKVVGVRRHVHQDDAHSIHSARAKAPVFPPTAIHDLLPRTDVLIIALPLTRETEGMIGAKELAMLPADALLVNVGRGPIIDEEALFNALRDNQILGAGLDVWYQYPTRIDDRLGTAPSRFPFHSLDNVVMSPHRGGFLSAAEANRITELGALLTAAAEGRTIPGIVDKDLGY